MVNKLNSSLSRRCKPAKMKRFSFYGRDAMVYTVYPPSNAASYSFGGPLMGPPPKTIKSNAPKFSNKSDLTHVSKGGKLLGYLTYDPVQPGRGLFVTTTDGEELYPLACEKEKGWGYIWTDEQMLRMIHSDRQKRPVKRTRSASMMNYSYPQIPNMIMAPPPTVCPFPPKIVEPPPTVCPIPPKSVAPPPPPVAGTQPQLQKSDFSSSKISFGRPMKKSVCSETDLRNRRSMLPKVIPLDPISPNPPGLVIPFQDPLSCTCPPPPYQNGPPCLGPQPYIPCPPIPVATPFQPPPPPSGIPIHFIPPSSCPPIISTSDVGIQAGQNVETCDRGVEAITGPPSKFVQSPVLCEPDKTNKVEKSLKLEPAEKKCSVLEEGCPIEEGPCSIQETKLAKRYLEFLRYNSPPTKRGFINETKPNEPIQNAPVQGTITTYTKPQKVPSKLAMRSTSTQCDHISLGANPSKTLNAPLPPNTSRIVVLKRSMTASPTRERSKRNLVVEELQPLTSINKPSVKDRVLSGPPGSEDSFDIDDRQRKWYFDGFRQPAPKGNKCIIS